MAHKVPKLQIRQKIQTHEEKTPPALIKWELNDLESAHWAALNSHLKVFQSSSRPRPYPSSDLSPRFQELQEPDHVQDSRSPKKARKAERLQKGEKVQESSPRPGARVTSKGPRVAEASLASEVQSFRPALMPSLDVRSSQIPSQGRSLLEKAEILSASEPIDQQSLRYQVKLRRNVELIHEEDLKQKENQWKERLLKKREELEGLQSRERELKEVVKKYSGKKENESEASKELARLIEVKARLKDDINLARLKKVELEKTVNELHVELSKESLSSENQEKNLLQDLESLKRQVEMSENEKLDTVAFTKENLARKKSELEAQRIELFDKWQLENKGFTSFFKETDQKRAEIRKQIQLLKTEKERLREETENFHQKQKELNQEKEIVENNKKTAGLAKSFQEFKELGEFKELSELVKRTAKKMVDKTFDDVGVEHDGSDLAAFLQLVRLNLIRRKSEIAENAGIQVKLIQGRIDEAEKIALKSSKSLKRLKKSKY